MYVCVCAYIYIYIYMHSLLSFVNDISHHHHPSLSAIILVSPPDGIQCAHRADVCKILLVSEY